jgi:CRP-like cAMP-binding protein
VRIKLALTHKEIAQMIGSSRETVTRLLADFRRRQLAGVYCECSPEAWRIFTK